MKKILYKNLLLLSCFVAMTACKKDDITVERNESTTWEVDKAITEADIRSRLGYDPRFDYAYLTQSSVKLQMLSLGNVPITGQNKREVTLKLVKPLQSDTQFSLVYDTSVYDKVKGDNSGLELGDANIVTVAEATKTISRGETTATFTLVSNNQSNFNKSVILPFSIKVLNNEKLKIVEGKAVVVAKVTPETVSVTTTTSEVTKSISVMNGAFTGNKEVSVVINSSVVLPTGLSVGLVRNDSALPLGETLIATGAEGTLPKVAFNSQQQTLSFNIDTSKLTTDLERYVLPLKYVLYDASGNAYDLPNNNIIVKVNVVSGELRENSRNARGNHDQNPSGNLVPKTDIEFSYAYTDQTGNPENAIDGDYESKTFFNAKPNGNVQWLYFDFSGMKTIKSIRLKVSDTHGIYYFGVYGAQGDIDDAKFQGWAQFTEGGEYYTVHFRQPISVDHILLTRFTSRRGDNAWYEIKEVDFYE